MYVASYLKENPKTKDTSFQSALARSIDNYVESRETDNPILFKQTTTGLIKLSRMSNNSSDRNVSLPLPHETVEYFRRDVPEFYLTIVVLMAVRSDAERPFSESRDELCYALRNTVRYLDLKLSKMGDFDALNGFVKTVLGNPVVRIRHLCVEEEAERFITEFYDLVISILVDLMNENCSTAAYCLFLVVLMASKSKNAENIFSDESKYFDQVWLQTKINTIPSSNILGSLMLFRDATTSLDRPMFHQFRSSWMNVLQSKPSARDLVFNKATLSHLFCTKGPSESDGYMVKCLRDYAHEHLRDTEYAKQIKATMNYLKIKYKFSF